MKTKSQDQKRYLGKWKSEAAEEKFRRMENELWAEAGGAEPAELSAATQFGPTAVFHWKGSGEPIVFLHGMTDTSRRWIPYVEALEGHDIYAIDIMGDVGRSRHDVGFTSPDDYAVWLEETLEALDITGAHIVGMSLGGYLALDLAARFPERVASLVLLEPVGIADLKLARFMLWAGKCGLAAMMPSPIRRRLARRLRQPAIETRAEARLMMHGSMNHPVAVPVLKPLPDEVLRSISAPVSVVLGGKSEGFNTAALVDRAEKLIPSVVTTTVPGAGHTVGASHPEPCLEQIRRAVLV